MLFYKPLDGNPRVTQTFKQHSSYGKGVDYAVVVGTPVKAAESGRVIFADKATGPSVGYGNLVRVDHGGGWTTYYAHLSAILVDVGDHVQAGQVVGKSGNTGASTGPHLHFEVRINNKPTDPDKLWAPTPAPEPEPEPEPGPSPFPVITFPTLPKARSLVAQSMWYDTQGLEEVGTMSKGDTFRVISAKTVGRRWWLKTGHNQWIIAATEGQPFTVEWV